MPFVITCCVISAVVVVVGSCGFGGFVGTFGGLVGGGGPSLVYLSTPSLGGDARIE